jgi:hypothetical protein
VNARSEFVDPTNFSAGFVVETTLRFQDASAASNWPARRPTRGSLAGVADCYVLGVLAHAASVRSPATIDNDRSGW